MKIKLTTTLLLILISFSSISQTKILENRNIDYYFKQVVKLGIDELIKQKVLIDSLTIAPEFKDTITNRINDKGFRKYVNIKSDVYMSFFKDYLFQQKLEYNDELYVLYFTMAGFDDMEWNIFKWKKDNWSEEERLSREKAENDDSIVKILWNYDEGPKNDENIRIFIKNDYLVMERSNLYHSLYDLKSQKVILNEESPWHVADGKDKEKMNEWIKENLHDKINLILNEKR